MMRGKEFGDLDVRLIISKRNRAGTGEGCSLHSVCDPRRQVENGGDLLCVVVDVEVGVTGEPVRH